MDFLWSCDIHVARWTSSCTSRCHVQLFTVHSQLHSKLRSQLDSKRKIESRETQRLGNVLKPLFLKTVRNQRMPILHSQQHSQLGAKEKSRRARPSKQRSYASSSATSLTTRQKAERPRRNERA